MLRGMRNRNGIARSKVSPRELVESIGRALSVSSGRQPFARICEGSVKKCYLIENATVVSPSICPRRRVVVNASCLLLAPSSVRGVRGVGGAMTAIRRSLAGASCARCTSCTARVVALWSLHRLVRRAGRLNACESTEGVVVGEEVVARQTTKPAQAQNARRPTPHLTSSSTTTTPSPQTSCSSKSPLFLCDSKLLTSSRCSSVRSRVWGGAV